MYFKFGEIQYICFQDIERKRKSDISQGNSVINVQKMMSNNPNLDHVNINAYTKFGLNSINLFSRYWAETKIWHQSR